MTDFYLTQRLQKRTYKQPDAKGLDVNFQLDYMGSSEFEWGAIPKALKSLREHAERFTIFESTMSLGTHTRTVYFVADEQDYQGQREHFGVWADSGFRGKESTHFPQVFRGEDEHFYGRTVAWWAINDNIAWTLDPELAPLLLAGLTNLAVVGSTPEGQTP